MNSVLVHNGKKSFSEQLDVLLKEYYQVMNLPGSIASEVKETIIEKGFPLLNRSAGMLNYTKQKARLMKRILLLESALIQFYVDKNHNRFMLSDIINKAMRDEPSNIYGVYAGRYEQMRKIAESVDRYEECQLKLFKDSPYS